MARDGNIRSGRRCAAKNPAPKNHLQKAVMNGMTHERFLTPLQVSRIEPIYCFAAASFISACASFVPDAAIFLPLIIMKPRFDT